MHRPEWPRPLLGTELDEPLSEPAELAERDSEGRVPSDLAAAPGADEPRLLVSIRGVGRIMRPDRSP
jgi:hypothetical protein